MAIRYFSAGDLVRPFGNDRLTAYLGVSTTTLEKHNGRHRLTYQLGTARKITRSR
jgi:hypothetical protein